MNDSSTRRRCEVALDTNVLGTLCTDVSDPVETLVAAVRENNARLVLLPETLVESFVGKVEYSRARAEMLAKVEIKLSGSCGVAITLDKLWRHEAKGQKLSGTPVFGHARVAGLVREPGVYDNLHARHADEFTKEIKKMQKRAATLETRAESRFRADTTKRERRNRHELLEDFAGERVLCRRPLSRILNKSLKDAADLLSDPAQVRQFRAHVLAAGLSAQNGLRALLYSYTTPEAEWLRRGRGNWVDARIAANAAYCDYFVTDDDGLYTCLEFLLEAGFEAPQPVRLNEFLESELA